MFALGKLPRAVVALALLSLTLISGCGRSERRANRATEREAAQQTTQPSTREPEQQTTQSTTAAIPGDRLVKNITTLVDRLAGRVDWSHANNLIAFGQQGDDEYSDIYTMNPDGSNQVCLTCDKADVAQLNNDQPTWHPNGEYIVFQSQDPNLKAPAILPDALEEWLTQGGVGVHNNLWAMTKDGQRFFQLTQIERGESILHPHFSDDGSKLMWAARERGGERRPIWELKVADVIVDAEGIKLANEQSFRPQGEEKTFYESHGFTPDNARVIFSSGIGRSNPLDLDIWTMDVATQDLTNLTDTAGVWDEHAIISPSGNKIVWISSQGYQFSPDDNFGKTLTTDYWLMNADGTDKTRLTYFNEPGAPEYVGVRTIVADSSWNKEGDKIVAYIKVMNNGGGENRIVLIELNSSQ